MTWASWIDFLLGAWLVIAPFALGFSAVSRGATIDNVVFGILIAAFGLWTALRKDAPKVSEWLLMLFGLWVLVSPFVMGMEAVARVTPNNVIVGIFVLLFGILRLATSHGPARTQAA